MKKSEELKIDLSRPTNCHSSAFHLACIGGNLKLAEMIMKNSVMLKIHLNEDNPFDFMSCGRSGFHYAIRYGNLEVVNIRGAICGKTGKTYLGLTSILKNRRRRRRQRRRAAILGVLPGLVARVAPMAPLNMLIKNSTCMNIKLNTLDKYNNTGLHIACLSGHAKIAIVLTY
jgi:ankyrin repeat protein